MLTRVTVILFAIACAATFATPAAARNVWTPPQGLSAAEQDGQRPKVAIADDGTAVAVWRYFDAATDSYRVQAVVRKRGENFDPGKAVFLSTPMAGGDLGPTTDISLSMNRRGDAIAVWAVKESNTTTSIRSAYKPAGQPFGAEQIADRTVGKVWTDPKVGIDGQGAATVIFGCSATGGGYNQYPLSSCATSSVFRGAGPSGAWAGFQAVFPLSLGVSEFAPRRTDLNHSLAVNERGDRLAALAVQVNYGDGAHDRQLLVVSGITPGQTTWLPRRSYDPFSTDHPVEATRATLAPNGNGVVAWIEAGDLFTAYRHDGLHHAEFSYLNQLQIGPQMQPAVAMDPSSRALLTWKESDVLRVDFRSFAEGSPTYESSNFPTIHGAGYVYPRFSPQIAVDGQGNAIVGYREIDPGENTLDDFDDEEAVQASFHPAGGYDAGWEEPIDISKSPNQIEDVPDPIAVAINSGGEGIAAWSRIDDSGNLLVEASLLVPPEAVPPPPPPRPLPPIPSAIQPARKIAKNQAVVLTATVAGDVRELRWSFDGKSNPPVVGRVVNGKLENSVRFRLPQSSFKVSVTAVGPGGSQTFSRTFTTPKPSSTGEAGKVAKAIAREKAPPVFAVAATKTLLGGGGCSPTTIWSGEQKLSGCFEPIEKIADVPGPERGVFDTISKELGLGAVTTPLMDKATQLTDGYVAKGKVALNDAFPVTPSAASSVVAIPQVKALAAARASLPVAGGAFDPKGGFNLKLDPRKAKVPLGKLPNPPKLPSLAGLELTGDWNVDLDKEEATVKASLKFPPSIKKAGVQISNSVALRATRERVIVDEVKVGPIDVDVASLKVQKFLIQYRRAPNQWDGQGKACVIGTACLDMAPPNGGVTLKNGDLTYAGATLQFPPPGLALFSGVNLERVGFGLGLRPTRINGSARIGVGSLLKLDGRILMAFPDSQTPFVLDRREAGDAYPPHLYGERFTRTTLGASAEAFLALPVVGETKLASAYLLYEFPDYAAFGGSIGADLLGVVSVNGGIAGEFDFGDAVFNLHGSIRACVHVVGDLCAGAIVNVSRGRGGTGGAGACIELGPFNVGGGVQWQRVSEPFIWPFDGCKWSRFAVKVRQSNVARASQAGPLTVTVKPGESPAVQLKADEGAPFVRVTGPGGQLDSAAGTGFAHTPDGTIRIMRFENAQAKLAVVGFQDAKPGTYKIEPLPGSPAVTSVAETEDPPAAKASAKVTGKGQRRVLSYDVLRRQDQKVFFYETGPGGTSNLLGTVAGGRGKVRFTPAPGRGRRRIVAQFELAGIAAERKVVASFRPPSPLLPKPRRVTVRRKGTRLLVSWKRVSGASRYEIAATMAGGLQKFTVAKSRRATVKGVPKYLSGRVTVRAVARLQQSGPAARRFRRTAKRPSAFRPLVRCKVVKKKIRCGKGAAKRKQAKRRKRGA